MEHRHRGMTREEYVLNYPNYCRICKGKGMVPDAVDPNDGLLMDSCPGCYDAGFCPRCHAEHFDGYCDECGFALGMEGIPDESRNSADRRMA